MLKHNVIAPSKKPVSFLYLDYKGADVSTQLELATQK